MLSSTFGRLTCHLLTRAYSLQSFSIWLTTLSVTAIVYFLDRTSAGDAFMFGFAVTIGRATLKEVLTLWKGQQASDGRLASPVFFWIVCGLTVLSARALELSWVMQRGGTIGRPPS